MMGRTATSVALAMALMVILFGAVQVAGQQPPEAEWIVFLEPQGMADFAPLSDASVELTATPGATVLRSISAFDAYVVRMSEGAAKALEQAPGVRRVVPNIQLQTGPVAEPLEQDAFGVQQSSLSPRITPDANLGGIAFGNEAFFDLRITNIGFATLTQVKIELQETNLPEGTVRTTGEPGPNEYRIDWLDPLTGIWEALDGNVIELPLQFSVLIGDQELVRIRVTLGNPGVAGGYTLGYTVSADGTVLLTPSTVADAPWHVRRAEGDQLWPWTKGAGIKIAVLDTGIDDRHTELAVADGCNAVGVEGCQPEGWEDDHSHGTAVAGVIGANKDRTEGLFPSLFNGMAPEAKLYAVKVCNDEGKCAMGDILAGLAWAKDNGMGVVNMSFGTADPAGEALCSAFESAPEIVFVGASGNNLAPVNYPAACPDVIAAGGLDADDALFASSARGPEMASKGLVAPAHQMFLLHLFPNHSVASGTSFAAPIVAGAAALLLSEGRDPEQVFEILAEGAVDLGMPAEEQGAGLVNAYRAWRSSNQ